LSAVAAPAIAHVAMSAVKVRISHVIFRQWGNVLLLSGSRRETEPRANALRAPVDAGRSRQ
jgi:hypothetical protein